MQHTILQRIWNTVVNEIRNANFKLTTEAKMNTICTDGQDTVETTRG